MLFVPLLIIIYGLIYVVVGVLPSGTLPGSISSGFSTVVGYAYVVNNFLPIDTFLTLLKYSVYVDGIMLLFWFGMFIINYVRGR